MRLKKLLQTTKMYYLSNKLQKINVLSYIIETSCGISKTNSSSRIALRYPRLCSKGMALFMSNRFNAPERTGFLKNVFFEIY